MTGRTAGAHGIPWVPAVSIALIAAGLVLGATAGMGFLALFGLGAFGPALLREAGLLRDEDEFQRAAHARAARRAWLTTGIFLTVVIAAREWGHAHLEHDATPASGVLAVLSVTYFLSAATSFWGARTAAFRILMAFGLFWLVFVVLSHWGTLALAPEAALTLPFFALAFAARRWPRPAGALLLLVGLAAIPFFRLQRIAGEQSASALMVFVVFVLPLLFCGWSLVSPGSEASE